MQHAITLTLAKRGGTPRSWQKRYNKYTASRRVNGAVYAEQKYYGRINPPMDNNTVVSIRLWSVRIRTSAAIMGALLVAERSSTCTYPHSRRKLVPIPGRRVTKQRLHRMSKEKTKEDRTGYGTCVICGLLSQVNLKVLHQ